MLFSSVCGWWAGGGSTLVGEYGEITTSGYGGEKAGQHGEE